MIAALHDARANSDADFTRRDCCPEHKVFSAQQALMSDFYLDLRPREARQTGLAAERLRHFKDVVVTVVEEAGFSVVIAREDDAATWAPFRKDKVSVFLAGRIALEAVEWAEARKVAGEGGLACKFIFKRYVEGGVKALESLNGNFTAMVHDGSEGQE